MDSTRLFPGGAHSLVADLPRRDFVLISTCIVIVAAIAWVYLIHLDRQMSASMAHDRMMTEMGMTMDMPWTATDAFLTFAMWVVMMIGMMAGTATPVLLLFAAAHAQRRERGASLAVLIFGLGYLAVWTGFSAFATVTQWALHRAAMLSPAMAASSPRVAGVILIGAGVYQLTPWKSNCLTHCRSPLGFLMTNWRDGKLGALRMGSYHGAYCLGCCWALMCVLFAVGVMNLVWVSVLTAFVLIEKIGPAGAIVARVAGATMVVFGILWAAAIL
jgi:predicted metal-binding membrane protein